ncbi:V-set domain containing T-cell activation inhibitor 1 [Antennarius striatus]|uniref:V-set domain containing T-cell activation inhibitor 1 n=1 Tax=Antennarius striatus TaxID=241820 RepID=UPI0035B4C4D0
MASLGQIIFCSMMVIIVIAATIIIIILSFAFTGSSEALSLNRFPIGNISRDVSLSCYLNRDVIASVSRVSVTWEKVGVGLVYQFQDNTPSLDNQDPQFRGRIQVSTRDLIEGNATMLLTDVRRSDEGTYKCSIRSSGGGGDININLRTAAFSAPTFTLMGDALTAAVNRWFPRPNVTWLDQEDQILQANTNLTEDSGGIFSVVSTLQPVNTSSSYSFRIENNLVLALARVALNDSGVDATTAFTLSAAPPRVSSTSLIFVTGVACLLQMT